MLSPVFVCNRPMHGPHGLCDVLLREWVFFVTDRCAAPMDYVMYYCEAGYSSIDEDKGDHLVAWQPLDITSM
ncbi:hypothetical protein DPMN_034407 [Dreissena polymorpha]|uniref:Uncharacterized protein n=1 Tax=Dreissena polymorpha TaxID=45954 RepID=A0A9D4RKY2_DREPO|nr:hypothetical protein DPMN_034407 [Dreissena polymorpha]